MIAERDDRDAPPQAYAAAIRALPRSLRELHVRMRDVPSRYCMFVALTALYPSVVRLCVPSPGRYEFDAHETWARQRAVLQGVADAGRRIAVRFETPCAELLTEMARAGGPEEPPWLAPLHVPWDGAAMPWGRD